MYKLLVLDFDDTLLTDELTISQENIDAILAAKEKGVYILFCSGRSNDSMKKYIDIMDIHDDHEFFVSFNGARIDTISGENIFVKAIEGPVLSELIDLGEEFGVTTQLYYDNKLIVKEETRLSRKYQGLTHMEHKIMPNIKELPYSTKVLFNCDEIFKLKEMEEIIKEKYSDVVNVFFSKPTYLEVLHPEANKGLAVKYMTERLALKAEEVIAVGDSYNDLFMIEYAGLGVVVQNGRDGVKEKANYITEATNNESAVAEVINKFIL